MPARSQAQKHLMGAALNAKRGGKSFPAARKLAASMKESSLEDFARGSGKGLPAHVGPKKRKKGGK